MSRVRLVLMIPSASKDDKQSKGIEVEGVVVREHPVIINGETKHYDIAIFFDNLSEESKAILDNYISSKE